MSISPITSSSSNPNPVVPVPSVQLSSQQPPAQISVLSTQDTEDTVQLSQISQIMQMAQQGESAATIASSTGVPVSEIDSDLGISTSASSVPVAVPSGHAGGHSTAPAPSSNDAAAPSAAASVAKAPKPASTLSVQV